MGARKNLVHNKLKRAKPNDIISFQASLPAYLLKDVKTYGDTAKVIGTALEMSNNIKHFYNLIELIADIRKNIELLENEKETDGLEENHLMLLELYRDVYFRLKQSEFLKRRRK